MKIGDVQQYKIKFVLENVINWISTSLSFSQDLIIASSGSDKKLGFKGILDVNRH